MSQNIFPPLIFSDWQPTLTTLQNYAQVIGKIRRTLTPAQRHWAHVSLRVGTTGLTTSSIPAGSLTFDLTLDLTNHNLVITTSRGHRWQSKLHGQSVAVFCEEALATLAQLNIHPDIDRNLFIDTTPSSYRIADVQRYWQAISQIDAIYKQFKGTLRGETSEVQLWPHHIDLAFLWFTGRSVPGIDPEDEENADEQMNFGFSPGDEGIPEPYFYIITYPTPDGLLETPLPKDATWNTTGFTGALMKYKALAEDDNPQEKLLEFLRIVQQAGAKLMK
jgi:hypothetical protein